MHQDIFDRIDDDGDDEHKQYLEEWNVTYQFDQLHRSVAEEEEPLREEEVPATTGLHRELILDQQEEERVLSQRLSQLSAESDDERRPSMDGKRQRPSSPNLDAKKIRSDTDHLPGHERIPTYLSTDRLMSLNIDMPSYLPIEDLQRLGFCLHQLAVLPIEEELWTGYRECGTGLWRERSIPNHSHFWPHHVKSLMSTKPVDGDEQHACETIVHQHLGEIRDQLVRYQKEYEDKQRTLVAEIPALEETLRQLVHEQAAVPLRMKVDMALVVLRYDDEDHCLQCQYQAANPTDYQKQVAKSLHETAVQMELAKCELVEYRQRLLCNRPPASYDYLQIPIPSSMDTVQRYEQLIQETKTRLVAVYLAGIEARIDQYQTRLREQTKQMWQQHRQHLPDREMSPVLAELIDKRASITKKKLAVINQFKIDYDVRSAYGREESIHRGKEKDLRRIGFLSSLILDPRMDAKHLLSEKQRQLLQRGPSYVPPCQLHLSVSLSSVDDLIKKQYAPLQHQMALLFSRYNIGIAQQENMKGQIKQEFKAVFSRPVPDAVLGRASREKQCLQSIQTTLKNNDWILRRTADHQNSFYLGQRKYFEEKCNAYMSQTDAYQLLFTVDEQSRSHVRQKLIRKLRGLNAELETLHKQKRLMTGAYETLRVNVDKVSIPYLYFLPELSTGNRLVVTPMIAAHHSATSRIARYLHWLLRPVIAGAMRRDVFKDEADFIQRLIQYSQVEKQLQPTTVFATIQVTNALSLVSHASLVETFTYFLKDQLLTNKLQYTSLRNPLPQYIAISTVTKLTELYLEHNLFCYQDKIYGFNKGGPNSLPFSDDLLNIYLFAWQQLVFVDERLNSELCGRHRHTLFLTWNQSEAELRRFLRSLTERYPAMQLQTSVGRSVQFCNTHVENRQGSLYTRLAYLSNPQPYTVPFVVDDAKAEHRRWLLAALMRAGQVCSNVSDFVEERIRLEMACLFAGYSLDFLELHLRYVFRSMNIEAIRFSMPQAAYDILRRRLFDSVEQQRIRLEKYHELEDQERVLRLHYLHDYGSRTRFHQRFHQIWTTYLKEDPQLSNEKTKIILHTKHVYSLNALLGEQKPSATLLTCLQA